MDTPALAPRLTRRAAVGLGAGLAGGLVAAHMARAADKDPRQQSETGLPVQEMENILKAEASVTQGLLHFSIDRKDIKNETAPTGANLTGRRIPFISAFELSGDFFFQPLGEGRAIMNADFPFKFEEVGPALDAMLKHGLVLQALHQHLMDMVPQPYFMHFRGVGSAVAIAHGIAAMLAVTSTPLPQHKPKNPHTPFDKDRLTRILGGTASVGDGGTVTVLVPRRNQVTLGGVKVSPFLNIATTIGFEPLDADGKSAAAVPDFAMTVPEVQRVMEVMRAQGWGIGCLYNQETDEFPQLYFSHQIKTGDPYVLAEEIRKGLNVTDAVPAGQHS